MMTAVRISVARSESTPSSPIFAKIAVRAANAADPVLSTVDPARRATLVATPAGDGYEFDIYLQGPGETVFFDV